MGRPSQDNYILKDYRGGRDVENPNIADGDPASKRIRSGALTLPSEGSRADTLLSHRGRSTGDKEGLGEGGVRLSDPGEAGPLTSGDGSSQVGVCSRRSRGRVDGMATRKEEGATGPAGKTSNGGDGSQRVAQACGQICSGRQQRTQGRRVTSGGNRGWRRVGGAPATRARTAAGGGSGTGGAPATAARGAPAAGGALEAGPKPRAAAPQAGRPRHAMAPQAAGRPCAGKEEERGGKEEVGGGCGGRPRCLAVRLGREEEET
ncbi:hypothetical protein BS78_02G077000 [Paspalum vaginatum]|nr:hypothetical protein BS78_02G077000 [Paspalum vaginatum]